MPPTGFHDIVNFSKMPQSPAMASQGCVSFVSEIQSVSYVNSADAATALTFFEIFCSCVIFSSLAGAIVFFICLKPGFESDYNKESDRISEESSFVQSPVEKTKMKIGNHAFREE